MTGLPAQAMSSVVVTGPKGFRKLVRGSSQVKTLKGLAPGRYAVAAGTVRAGDLRYTPTPRKATVSVTRGRSTTLTVAYSVASADPVRAPSTVTRSTMAFTQGQGQLAIPATDAGLVDLAIVLSGEVPSTSVLVDVRDSQGRSDCVTTAGPVIEAPIRVMVRPCQFRYPGPHTLQLSAPVASADVAVTLPMIATPQLDGEAQLVTLDGANGVAIPVPAGTQLVDVGMVPVSNNGEKVAFVEYDTAVTRPGTTSVSLFSGGARCSVTKGDGVTYLDSTCNVPFTLTPSQEQSYLRFPANQYNSDGSTNPVVATSVNARIFLSTPMSAPAVALGGQPVRTTSPTRPGQTLLVRGPTLTSQAVAVQWAKADRPATVGAASWGGRVGDVTSPGWLVSYDVADTGVAVGWFFDSWWAPWSDGQHRILLSPPEPRPLTIWLSGSRTLPQELRVNETMTVQFDRPGEQVVLSTEAILQGAKLEVTRLGATGDVRVSAAVEGESGGGLYYGVGQMPGASTKTFTLIGGRNSRIGLILVDGGTGSVSLTLRGN